MHRTLRVIAILLVTFAVAALTALEVKAGTTVGFGIGGGWWRGIHRWQFPDTDPSGPVWDSPDPNPARVMTTPVTLVTAVPPVAIPYINVISRQNQGRIGGRPATEPQCQECDPPGSVECGDHVIQIAGMTGSPGAYSPVAFSYASGIGSPWAGPRRGLSASTPADSAFASDSMAVQCQVVAGDSIKLSNFRGFLVSRPTVSPVRRRTASSHFFIAVYADSNDMNQDIENTGGGAVWHGRVVVAEPGGIAMSGNFSGPDFALTTLGDGTRRVTPNASMVKTIKVPNGAAAVVKLVVDPRVDLDAPLPGASPAGLLALSAAMAGAGLFVMMRRRRSLA